MPSSDDDEPSPETLVDRLEADDPATRREAASALARRFLEEGRFYAAENLFDGETPEVIAAGLDDPDPEVRAHLAIVARRILGIRTFSEEGVYCGADGTLLDRYLALADDEDWRVRQSVVHVGMFEELLKAAVADESRPTDLQSRLSSVLVDRLDDPVAVIRKRAGELLVGDGGFGYAVRGYDEDAYDHGAAVFLRHPDPAGAVPVLIEALSDPVDGVTGRASRGRSPRHTAGTVLASLGTERPDLLEPHRDRLIDALDSPDDRVRVAVAAALAPSLDRWDDAVEPVEDALLALIRDGSDQQCRRGTEIVVDTIEGSGRDALDRPAELAAAALDNTARILNRDSPEGTDYRTRSTVATAFSRALGFASKSQGRSALETVQVGVTAYPAKTQSVVPGVLAFVRECGATESAVEILAAVADDAPDAVREAGQAYDGPDEFPDSVTAVLEGVDTWSPE
ncbi:hypothetical protein [Natrinema longum]|uniref:Uncharacterized protein n=1 Tax=Natrinema longum TaxID=370324 RepID=A0A8A2UBL9_9EURY|nr:hypothetical protein [Natrinema longum]MBZ6493364.1 hypothetical protein [Natrinema longum]QSW85288.1 hypothetical protein J0X27_00095 [Natrinema longum]